MRRTHHSVRLPILATLLLMLSATPSAEAEPEARAWLSSEKPARSLEPQPPLRFDRLSDAPGAVAIEVRPDRRFQKILGMGASLEATTCSNLWRMALPDRERALELLMDRRAGLGMNLMRLCIGTSDFTGDPWYSYDDVPPGQTDPELGRFSIEKDRQYILPIIRLAQAKNPATLFFASPWSPPGWMKSNDSLIGGELQPRFYDAYAQYFVKFIQAYQSEGIPIHAVTVQNEPGVDRARSKDPKWHYPSCHWTASQESVFIARHLGPALRRAGLRTKIWCYDHNYNLTATEEEDGISHPMQILADPDASPFVDGVAFHGYQGDATGMSRVREAFPRVPIYFTEGSVFSIYGARDLIARFRNWACSYNAWVMILDENGHPNNGPFPAKRAILGLNSATLQVARGFEYFNYAQFMKFVERGAWRIGSSEGEQDLNNVAFQNPDGTIVLVVANTGDGPRELAFRHLGRQALTTLSAKSVITVTWPGRDSKGIPRLPVRR